MKVAILHEGNAGKSEDNKLLKAMIQAQGLDESRVIFYGMGTKSNFIDYSYKDYQELIPLIEADQIGKVLLTADADSQKIDRKYGGYENSMNMLKGVAQHFKMNELCQFYVFCDPSTRQGNVESLLLTTLSDEKKTCIENFLDCSGFKARGNSKAILNDIYNRAYPEPPYNFEHQHFDDLKQKLAKLFE